MKRRNWVKHLTLILVPLLIVGIGAFVYFSYFSSSKTIYSTVMQNYSDSLEESYIEKDSNFINLKTETFNYSSILNTYKNVSNAVSQKIEYFSPYFLYTHIDKKNINKIKTLNTELKRTHDEFEKTIVEINAKINSHTIAPVDEKENIKKTVNLFFFTSFLPRYLNYVNALQEYSLILENALIEKNIISTNFKNTIDLQNVLIDFSLNFALPSINLSEMQNLDYEKLVSSENLISVVSLTEYFSKVVKTNTFVEDGIILQNFEYCIYEIKALFAQAKSIFKNLTLNEKNVYLRSDKSLPANLDPSSVAFNENLMRSILAKNNGNLFLLSQSENIANFIEKEDHV